MDVVRVELSEVKQKFELYQSLHRFDAAEKLLKAAIADYGPLANLQNMLGIILHRQGRFVEALREFKRSLDANPEYLEAGLNLVATLCDLSHYEEARKLYTELVAKVNPTKRQPNLVLGRIANQHAESGRSYEESGMLNEAVGEYRKALGLFDRLTDVRLSLVKLYMRLGQFDRAREECEELVRQDGDSTDGKVWLGLLYAKLGRKDLAKRQWETARRRDPKHPAIIACVRLAEDWPVEISAG